MVAQAGNGDHIDGWRQGVGLWMVVTSSGEDEPMSRQIICKYHCPAVGDELAVRYEEYQAVATSVRRAASASYSNGDNEALLGLCDGRGDGRSDVLRPLNS